MKLLFLIPLLLIPVDKKVQNLCWSVTNYWPFDEAGNATPLGGQADIDPYHTANMTSISADDDWLIAAVPLSYVGNTLIFPNGWEVNAADTFGDPIYQAGPFYHEYYNQWVFPVDVMTPQPLHYLECGGIIRN